jgi:hypothetical protein
MYISNRIQFLSCWLALTKRHFNACNLRMWWRHLWMCCIAVVFNLFSSRTLRRNFSSTLYPQSCWHYFKLYTVYSLQLKKKKLKLNSVAWVCERSIPTERQPMSAKLVPNFADRGCHFVSVKDPYGRILGFIDRRCYFFFSNSSSIVPTRLSGPRSRPTTSLKIW